MYVICYVVLSYDNKHLNLNLINKDPEELRETVKEQNIRNIQEAEEDEAYWIRMGGRNAIYKGIEDIRAAG